MFDQEVFPADYDELLSWSKAEQMRYVRGFGDGEAGPRLYHHRSKDSVKMHLNIRSVVFSNTDLRLLATVRRIQKNVGVDSKIYINQRAGEKKATKESYALVIVRRSSLEIFTKLVNFTNTRKADILSQILSSYNRTIKKVK